MSTTIESLELEIQSNSTSAVSGIETLSKTLGKLKNATKGGLGLGAINKNMGNLPPIIQQVDKSFSSLVKELTAVGIVFKKVADTIYSFI